MTAIHLPTLRSKNQFAESSGGRVTATLVGKGSENLIAELSELDGLESTWDLSQTVDQAIIDTLLSKAEEIVLPKAESDYHLTFSGSASIAFRTGLPLIADRGLLLRWGLPSGVGWSDGAIEAALSRLLQNYPLGQHPQTKASQQLRDLRSIRLADSLEYLNFVWQNS